MSSVKEIEHMFVKLRESLGEQHAKQLAKLGKGQEDKKAEAEQLWLYVQMGLFVGESLVVDIKRIADAMQEPNEYGEVGPAAISGAILRGLRDR